MIKANEVPRLPYVSIAQKPEYGPSDQLYRDATGDEIFR
jgi:hypothetical protein